MTAAGRRPVSPGELGERVGRWVLFVVTLAASLAMLALGAGAVAASIWPGVHETLHVQGLGAGVAARAALRMADASHNISLAQASLDYLFSVFNLVMATFLIWLRPRDRTAVLLAVGMVGTAAVFNLVAQSTYEAVPLTPAESIFRLALHLVTGVQYVAALLLFPDGKLVPRWRRSGRVLLFAPATAGAVLLFLRAQESTRPSLLIVFFGVLAPLAGVAAQAYRFGRAPTAAEHQQARLLFWALLPALAIGVLFVATRGFDSTSTLAGRPLADIPVFAFRVFQPVFAIIPIALFAGILRYRLWDVDRLVNRTLVYAGSTAVLAVAYLGIVVFLQRLFSPLTGESTFAVMASTLAVATAFRPARDRIQTFVDRRFYRRKYDAARTVESFGDRLRDQIDLNSLTLELLAVVGNTMRPTSAALWIRGTPDGTSVQAAQEPAAHEALVPQPAATGRFRLLRRARASRTPAAVAGLRRDGVAVVDIPDSDALVAYFAGGGAPLDPSAVIWTSPTIDLLRAQGARIVVPLITQGDLIALLFLGSRLSEQEYSSDDRKLLARLAGHAAPALRVAQLVQQQQAQIRVRERVEHELRVARLIQQHFLPQETPQLDGWAITSHYQPARMVGGDFYDYIDLADGKLGLVVGDVTDKGIPAAMVMSAARNVLRGSAQRLASPGEVLARVNDLLCETMPPNMFVTCLYGVLDLSSGRLLFANAGHSLPYVRTERGCVELRARGMPLGLMQGMVYEENQALLSEGDILLLHSDGLIEAHSPAGEMFGCPRLSRLLAEARDLGVRRQQVIGALMRELEAFTGTAWEQEDDITLVTVERTGAAVRNDPVTPAAVHRREMTTADSADERTLAEFDVPSDRGNERLAMDRVAQVAAGAGFDPTRLERLKTAVSEAAMNAIEHGNHFDPALNVHVRVLSDGVCLRVFVTDHGAEDEIPEAVTPDIDAKIAGDQSPRGWGLFLIKNMVDEMNVTSDATHHTVELVLQIGE